MEIEQGDLVDPPSGWKYGFPKPWDAKAGETIDQWLVRHGYPQAEINIWQYEGIPFRVIRKEK